MEMCAYCGTPMLGGRCTNLNCRIANEKRNNKRDTISKKIENDKKAPVKKAAVKKTASAKSTKAKGSKKPVSPKSNKVQGA